jgi:molecular chaperone DnaK
MQAFSAAGQQFYQAQAAAGETGAGPGDMGGMGGMGETPDVETTQTAGATPEDDVIEADYEIVDDEKK